MRRHNKHKEEENGNSDTDKSDDKGDNKNSAKNEKKEEKKGIRKFLDLNKWKVKTAILFLSLVVLVILFLLFLKLNFMVDEQLRMTVDPEYKEITVTSPMVVTFETDVKIYNKFVCKASCNYELIDMSNNDVLDNGSFSSTSYKNEKYSRDIVLDDMGYGTKMYLYRIECTNTYSSLCPAVEDRLVRKSLLVVSYSPGSDQLDALEHSKNQYAQASSDYSDASKMIAGTGIIIGQAGNDIPINTSQYHSMDGELSSLDNDFDDLIDLWDDGDAFKIKAFIEQKNLAARSKDIRQKSIDYNSVVVSYIRGHAALYSNMTILYPQLYGYAQIESMPKELSGISLSSDLAKLKNAINSYNALLDYTGQQYDQPKAYSDFNALNAQYSDAESSLKPLLLQSIAKINAPVYVHSKIACLNDDNDCINNDYSYLAQNIYDASGQIDKLCNIAANAYGDSLIDYGPMILPNGNNSNSSNATNLSNLDLAEPLLLQYKLLVEYYSLTGDNASLQYIDSISTDLSNAYGITDPENHLNKTFNSSSIYFDEDNMLLSVLQNITLACDDYNITAKLSVKIPDALNYNMSILDDLSIYNVSVDIRPVPAIMPKCCIYDRCQACDKKPQKDPLILLHGHSFVEDTHAYRSIEIFDSFEKELADDELYYMSGMLIPASDSTQGILGRYYVPVVSKPTYYLESYNDLLGLTVSESKTGNIDTYALRVKEYIDYTLYLTGAEKVDIVAHSMGGLAVRRYLQVFGDDKVDTIVLIGTPNHGVTDKAYSICRLFGSANECDDMKEGGLFLRKLNDRSNTAITDKMYLVIGKGCDTDGLDGDGVVTVNSSLIDAIPKNRILYVNGTCAGTAVLHNALLDTEKYPQVYEYVVDKVES